MLAVSVALVGIINPFYLYLCALLLFSYALASLIERYGDPTSNHLATISWARSVALLGVGLGALITLPYLQRRSEQSARLRVRRPP